MIRSQPWNYSLLFKVGKRILSILKIWRVYLGTKVMAPTFYNWGDIGPKVPTCCPTLPECESITLVECVFDYLLPPKYYQTRSNPNIPEYTCGDIHINCAHIFAVWSIYTCTNKLCICICEQNSFVNPKFIRKSRIPKYNYISDSHLNSYTKACKYGTVFKFIYQPLCFSYLCSKLAVTNKKIKKLYCTQKYVLDIYHL